MARPFAIYTDNAPAPAPELSQAVQINDMIFCSGTMAIDPETGHLIENTFKKRVERCLINLESILIAAECDFKNVVKVNVFSTDMRNLDELDESYNEFVNRFDMDGDPVAKPARTCVAVHQLPWGTDVMIDCIAVKGRTGSEEPEVVMQSVEAMSCTVSEEGEGDEEGEGAEEMEVSEEREASSEMEVSSENETPSEREASSEMETSSERDTSAEVEMPLRRMSLDSEDEPEGRGT